MGWLKYFPFAAPGSTFHDNWANSFPFLKPLWDPCLKYTFGHIIAFPMTAAAYYASNNPGYYMPSQHR